MAANKVDCLVVGSGVIGLACARSLARRGREVICLDKASRIGAETSSRNSGVIHSGIYYPDKSFKSRFCVQGRKLLYDYCKERNIPFNQCGKLVVATSEGQFQSTIQQLHRQAQRNGVRDTRILTKDEVLDMEPLVESYGALYSPSTGVLDVHALMTSLLADAESHGATLALRATVNDARFERDGCFSFYVEDTWITARHVINASGLWADRIARHFHKISASTGNGASKWQPPQQYFCKGSYFYLNKTPPFRHLIYPLPDQRGGLGVHATIDMLGQVKFGPDVEWLSIDSDPDFVDYTPNPDRVNAFYAAIRAYYPSLPEQSLQADYAGVRPKLSHPSIDASENALLFHDFQISTEKDHGVSGLVHLFGMESPGLTSAMAIAEYVCDELLA
jgi:L-2-hydroxyglutarate oxidase LhgO